MRKARGRWALKFAAILLTPLLLGVTYKWVDPQGQVHFSDSPPREVAGTAGATPDDLRGSSWKCWQATGRSTSRALVMTGPT